MDSDEFSLTWEDVLFMQLLLQYFDSQKDISVKSYESHLYISLDPRKVYELKQQFNIGMDKNKTRSNSAKRSLPPHNGAVRELGLASHAEEADESTDSVGRSMQELNMLLQQEP
jgi:hypothetical protein